MKKLTIFLTVFVFMSSAHASNFRAWCNDKLADLRYAQSKSMRMAMGGNYSGSIQNLVVALQTASSDPIFENTLTKKAIKRSNILAQSVFQSIKSDRNSLRVYNYFLNKYVEYIYEVAEEIDLPYYQSGHCGYCNLPEKLERSLVNYAYSQVDMTLDSFTTKANGRVYPKGSMNLFMSVLELTSGFAASDLESGIFAEMNACSITELRRLSAEVSYLENLGPQGFYQAVAMAEEISTGRNGCGDHYDNGDDYEKESVIKLLDSPIYLANGTTMSLDLPYRTYIKKIIVVTEGVRNDTKYNVSINGRNWTVYAPGRDPSYEFAVDDYAGSIELLNHFGKAKITQIFIYR